MNAPTLEAVWHNLATNPSADPGPSPPPRRHWMAIGRVGASGADLFGGSGAAGAGPDSSGTRSTLRCGTNRRPSTSGAGTRSADGLRSLPPVAGSATMTVDRSNLKSRPLAGRGSVLTAQLDPL